MNNDYVIEGSPIHKIAVQWKLLRNCIGGKLVDGLEHIASIVAGIMAALVVIVPAVLGARSQRRKDDAEQSRSITQQWIDITEELKERDAHRDEQLHLIVERVRSLESENYELKGTMRDLETMNEELQRCMDELEEKNRKLSQGVQILIVQIRRLGHEPDWDDGGIS